jgi:hypothetical protein
MSYRFVCNKMKTSGIYKIVNRANCKYYVGSSNFKVAKSYMFISPSVEVVQIHNLKQYCRINNPTYSTMIQLSHGKGGYKSHKGWTKYV